MTSGERPEEEVPRQSALPDSHTRLWVCGRMISRQYQHATWDFVGVFRSRALAVEACLDDTYFIGPAPLDVVCPSGDWPGCEYPLAPKVV